MTLHDRFIHVAISCADGSERYCDRKPADGSQATIGTTDDAGM